MNEDRPDNEHDTTRAMAADAEQPDRPRERMANVGPEHLSDAELMALIISQPSVELPTQLLAKLGGLRGIAQASESEIQRAARGIGPVRAAMIRAAVELGRRCVGERPQRGQRLASAADVWVHYRARLCTSLGADPVWWTPALGKNERRKVTTCRGLM